MSDVPVLHLCRFMDCPLLGDYVLRRELPLVVDVSQTADEKARSRIVDFMSGACYGHVTIEKVSEHTYLLSLSGGAPSPR